MFYDPIEMNQYRSFLRCRKKIKRILHRTDEEVLNEIFGNARRERELGGAEVSVLHLLAADKDFVKSELP